ncbi:hypothetical protein J6590_098606 [Homalodisca vitripennis]|nr:hypothetical protein J6590_098606 [Homalodisca vitripennis]
MRGPTLLHLRFCDVLYSKEEDNDTSEIKTLPDVQSRRSDRRVVHLRYSTHLRCKGELRDCRPEHQREVRDCTSSFVSRVESLIDWAQQEGKATGIVANTRVSHATPAALYAHSASRYWEDDSYVPATARKYCKDIARQLVKDDPGSICWKKIGQYMWYDVVMGGGRRHWLPKVSRDPEEPSPEGRRLDGRNLIDD